MPLHKVASEMHSAHAVIYVWCANFLLASDVAPIRNLGRGRMAASVLAAAQGTITVTAPASGSKVTVPFDVHFTYSATATYTKLWIDGWLSSPSTMGAPSITRSRRSLLVATPCHCRRMMPAAIQSLPLTYRLRFLPLHPRSPSASAQPRRACCRAHTAVHRCSPEYVEHCVTWTVDTVPGGSSSVGTITGTGTTVTYTAPATAGPHTVTATSVANTGAFASAG